jgi:mRNA interferase MazF
MPSYSKHDVILIRYPFTDLSGSKVRPAVVVSVPHSSSDLFVVALTSRTEPLVLGEFVLTEWAASGLNVPTAVKRSLHTLHSALVVRTVGRLVQTDSERLEQSLRQWLGLP